MTNGKKRFLEWHPEAITNGTGSRGRAASNAGSYSVAHLTYGSGETPARKKAAHPLGSEE
jgi:hypothetical protein